MRIVPVDNVPERGKVHWTTRVENKPLREYLTAFLESGEKYGQVEYEFDEYADEFSAASSIRWAVRRLKLPIDVRFRDRGIYLINRNV